MDCFDTLASYSGLILALDEKSDSFYYTCFNSVIEIKKDFQLLPYGRLITALKAKYEASTWSRCIILHNTFHCVSHDTSKPIEQYVQKGSDLRDQLTTLGETISDNYFKDVLLANLGPLYVGIRNMLLSQPAGESNLDTVKSVISGVTYIAPEGDNVKAELEETALATRNGGRKEFTSSGSGHRKPVHCAAHSSSGDEGPGIDDKEGFH
ncbi:hypothetical protein B0H10DRAFT_1937874 [Mycena sp. CBHHK59/15]|nr:hypothetical protein B0H10DRAFT_1937874 [Mycena sp. CBHHK59/15]